MRLARATVTDGYTHTRYPIVLVHGPFGFDQLFGSVDYGYGITGGLRSGGATDYLQATGPRRRPTGWLSMRRTDGMRTESKDFHGWHST